MTDFQFSPYHNRLAEFALEDGSAISGVIIHYHFFANDPPAYFLIKSHKLREYKSAFELGDKQKCIALAEVINLDKIATAKNLQ